jgi:transposase
MGGSALETALYANWRSKRGHRRIAEPDWAGVHRELKRKHVTLLILWDEYIAANPGGYSYSRYVAAGVMWRKPEKWPVSLARTAT